MDNGTIELLVQNQIQNRIWRKPEYQGETSHSQSSSNNAENGANGTPEAEQH